MTDTSKLQISRVLINWHKNNEFVDFSWDIVPFKPISDFKVYINITVKNNHIPNLLNNMLYIQNKIKEINGHYTAYFNIIMKD